MVARTDDVERSSSSADSVESFDLARLLKIADQYAVDKKRANEFSTTQFAKMKGWTYERAMQALAKMEKDGIVVSRRAGAVRYWCPRNS